MDVFEEINYLEKGIAIKDNEINSLKENRNNKIALLKKEYEGYINTIEVNKEILEESKERKLKKVLDYSKFDITQISDILIKLIEKEENITFILKRVFCEDEKNDCYYAYLVGPKDKIDEYPSKVETKDGNIPLVSDDIFNIGTVNWETFYDNKTVFYNINGKAIDTKKYDYIYSFINYVIKFKIDNKKEDITEKELEELLDNYLFDMKKKESYAKKRGGKKC